MRTNIDIDNELLKKAMSASGLRTKRATIEEALRMYIQVQGQKQILRLRGKVAWEGNLDQSRLGRVADDPSEYKP